MESGTRARPSKALLLGGILGALLLAQGAACLRCYSCRDANDGGCAADFIKIEECAPPRNICLEAVHVVTLDNQTLSAAMKGCDVGTNTNLEFESGVPNPSTATKSRIHACSEDLCNTLLTRDFIKRPDNGSRPSVLRDNECYSCLSTSADQCSAMKATVVKCHGDEEVCYYRSSTITFGNMQTFTMPYFMKTCSHLYCSTVSNTGAFMMQNFNGSCCWGNLCNGVLPVSRGTALPHLILAAILSIISL